MELKFSKKKTSPYMHSKKTTKDIMKNVFIVLVILAVYSIGVNVYLYTMAHAVQALLICVVSVFVARETEVLYYSHLKDMTRAEAKIMIKKTYPEVTGLIFALIIPVGLPLWAVAVGSFVSIFLGKLVFGGFAYNPFNPAGVGRIFVMFAWGAMMYNKLTNSFGSWLLLKIFNNADVDVVSTVTPLTHLSNLGGINSYDYISREFDMQTLLFGFHGGSLGETASVLIIILGIYLIIKKKYRLESTCINYIKCVSYDISCWYIP